MLQHKTTKLYKKMQFMNKVNVGNEHKMIRCETLFNFRVETRQVSSQEGNTSRHDKAKQCLFSIRGKNKLFHPLSIDVNYCGAMKSNNDNDEGSC